jgi:hypothetical protein
LINADRLDLGINEDVVKTTFQERRESGSLKAGAWIGVL